VSLRIRQAARALVLSADRHVLLVRFEFPAGTRWALPGGGLESGESHLEAVRRELVEEVGLDDVEIGPHIWTREHHVLFIDKKWDGQREHVHLVRVDDRFEPRPAVGWDVLRSEYLHEIRWWSIDELATRSDIVWVPGDLPRLIAELERDGTPSEPLEVGG